MTARTIFVICFVFCILAPAWAQPWTISKVVDNTTPCTSSAFFNPYNSFAAIEGPWVVFVDAGNDNCTTNNGESLWSYNLITDTFVKLADTTTPVPPSNTYEYEGFLQNVYDNLQVHDGTVLFYGYDAGFNPTTNCSGGLYTVPVGGGTITRVVDYSMTLPGEGGSFCTLFGSYGINGLLGMSLDRGTVVFSAQANPGANDGIWSAPAGVNTKESQLKRIADGGTLYYTPFPTGCKGDGCEDIYQWFGGFIGGTTTAFTGGGSPSGLFLNKSSDPLLLSNYVLPDDNGVDLNQPYDTSFYYGPVVDGNNIFFLALDPFYTGTCGNGGSGQGTFGGVFETTTKGKTATSIMNTCDTQPNGDPLNGPNSFLQMAANEGTAVFEVEDETTGDYVLDSSVNGVVSKLIAPGDPLPTGASCNGMAGSPGCVYKVSPGPGTGGMSGGRVVFAAEGGPYFYDAGIYVASLACARAASNVSVTLGTLTYDSKTGIWSQSASVKNTGKTVISGPLSLVLADLSSDATLTDGNGSTVCFAPAGSPYINLPLTDNELKHNASEKVTLEFSAPADADITFTPEVAGAGAR